MALRPRWLFFSVAFVAVLLPPLSETVPKTACHGTHTQKVVCLVHWVKETLSEQLLGSGATPSTHLGAAFSCSQAPSLLAHILLNGVGIALFTAGSPVYKVLLENKTQDFHPCFSITAPGRWPLNVWSG